NSVRTTSVTTSIPSNPSTASTKPTNLRDLDAPRRIYTPGARLRALWTRWSVEVRDLSGAPEGPALSRAMSSAQAEAGMICVTERVIRPPLPGASHGALPGVRETHTGGESATPTGCLVATATDLLAQRLPVRTQFVEQCVPFLSDLVLWGALST